MPRDLVLLLREAGAAAEPVDRLVARGPDQPGHGIVRHAGRGPLLERHLDRLIEASTLEEIEAPDPFLRFGEGAVSDQELALACTHGLGLADMVQTVAKDPASFPVVARDPFLYVVLGRIEGLGRRIDTH